MIPVAVIIEVTIGSSTVLAYAIVENMLPGVVLLPVAWLAFMACICVALIVWWFTRPSGGRLIQKSR